MQIFKNLILTQNTRKVMKISFPYKVWPISPKKLHSSMPESFLEGSYEHNSFYALYWWAHMADFPSNLWPFQG